jgi:hypothetical protein
MPNGGSDCCGTCCFNKRNKGEVGYAHQDSKEHHFCLIRETHIEDGFWTYCTNHPHVLTERSEIPVGPILVNKAGRPDVERQIWQDSPDTPAIRENLLRLLGQFQESVLAGETLKDGTPLQSHFAERLQYVVICQLAAFRERRAITDLERIVRTYVSHKNLARTAGAAIAKISKGEHADVFQLPYLA